MGINPGKILTKSIGLTGLFLVGRDAHLFGIAGKNKYPQAEIARDYPDMFINSQRVTSSSVMTASAKYKKDFFNYCMEDTTMPAINGVIGYCKMFNKAIINDIVPLALSIGAVAFKYKPKSLSKFAGIACATSLALAGTKAFIYDICGFGQYKKL